VSGDGRLVGAVANSTFHLLDTEDWTVTTSAPCEVTSAAFEYYDTNVHYVWLGCADGTVSLDLWDTGDFSNVQVAGTPVSYDTGDTKVDGLWAYEDGGLIYVLGEKDDQTLYLHSIEADNGTADGETSFPLALPRTGFIEGVRTTSRLILFQGGSNVSQLTLGGSAILPNLQNYPYSVTDAAPSIRDSAYIVSSSIAAEYLPTTFVYEVLKTSLDSASAIAASTATDDEWLAIDDASGVSVYTLSNGTISGTDPVATFDPGIDFVDMAVARWGYGFAGTSNGRLDVLTANPWVSDVAVSPETAQDGDTVTFTFTVDEDADYEVFVGGDASGSGDSQTTGSATAGTPVTVDVPVDSRFSEGDDPIYVLATSSDGLVGHGTGYVTVDAPPPAVSPTIRESDSALTVSFTGLTVPDLAYYTIYISTTAFTADEWPTGGPSFDGSDAIDAPIQVTASPGDDIVQRISPLTNGQVYYIAVRATDAGGKEGPMSDVVQGTPAPIQSATDLAGDGGGPPSCGGCATTGPGSLSLLGLVGLLALAGRRRSRWLAVLLLALAVPGLASAQDSTAPRGDITPAWANLRFLYSGFSYLQPSSIVDVYGKGGHAHFQLMAGPQIYRFLELDAGIGYSHDTTFTRDPTTQTLSATGTALTQFPLVLDATGRLHIWDEQVIVPFAHIGVDYILWRERADDGSGSKTITTGAKAGWHYGFGGELLLDTFAPRRASQLEANTGINDTWLVVEWKRQRVDPGKFLFLTNSDGLSFSGDALTVGLKLDW